MSYLAASPHVSKRGVEEVVETIFAAPMSLGTVVNLEQEMSQELVSWQRVAALILPIVDAIQVPVRAQQ